MRKRRASLTTAVAKRTALALMLTGPCSLPASWAMAMEKPPVLHVAEQTPMLHAVAGESASKVPTDAPRSSSTSPQSSRRAPAGNRVALSPAQGWNTAAPRTTQPSASDESAPPSSPMASAQLASANEGWIAREAIGKQVPLTDPQTQPVDRDKGDSADIDADGLKSSPADSAAADDTPLRETESPAADATPLSSPSPRSLQPEVAEPSDNEVLTAPGPIDLDDLQPVPLMTTPSEPSELSSSEDYDNSLPEGKQQSLRSQPPSQADSATPQTTAEPRIELAAPSDPQPAADERESIEAADQETDRWERADTDLPIRRPSIGAERSGESDAAFDESSPQRSSVASSRRRSSDHVMHDSHFLAPANRDPQAGHESADEESADPPAAVSSSASAAQAQTGSSRGSRYVGDGKDVAEAKRHADAARRHAAPPVISASVAHLQRPIEQCLQYYYRRPENATGRSNWGMMHAIMVYGVNTQLTDGRKQYNTIAWLAGNNVCRGKRLFTTDRYGIAPRQGVGLQGHQGQLLAVFGLVGVPAEYPLYVNRQKFKVGDLIAHEQRECRSGEELTFTLIALAHYIDTDSQWRAKDGQVWDFERLIQEELAQPVVGSACGGTHRLMGLSHALRIRKEEGLPITGQWARAETFIADFTDYAWKLQNRDGSMSTEWFEGRGDNGDVDRKIQTTGHIVEWLLCHAPDEQLQDERMVRAIRFLTSAMSNNPSREKEIGPKGHALRSLALYHQRVFDAADPWEASGAGSGAPATAQRRRSSYR